jgi:hypothetical protein
VDVFAPWLREQGLDVGISAALASYLGAEKMKSMDLVI